MQETLHDEVVLALSSAFPDGKVRVCGDEDYKHIEVFVSSRLFAGKRLVASHRMVLDVLDSFLSAGVLHAVSVKVEAISD